MGACHTPLRPQDVIATSSDSTVHSFVMSVLRTGVVPFGKPLYCALNLRSFGFSMLRNMVPPSLVITHTSTLLPEPKSLKIPALMALATSVLPSSMVKLSLYPDSRTDIAAREPLPIVVKGSMSVEPCG